MQTFEPCDLQDKWMEGGKGADEHRESGVDIETQFPLLLPMYVYFLKTVGISTSMHKGTSCLWVCLWVCE